MFGIGYATKGMTQCDRTAFYRMIDSKEVSGLCEQIARLEKKLDGARNESERKAAKNSIAMLKKRLPCITPMAWFKGGVRKAKNAVPSGLDMLDIDHVEEPRSLFLTFPRREGTDADGLWFGEFNIVAAHITPSTRGLRLIFVKPGYMSIEEGQSRLAQLLGVDYDGCTKDLSRCSFLVPRSYFLYLDDEKLFSPLPTSPRGGENLNSLADGKSACARAGAVVEDANARAGAVVEDANARAGAVVEDANARAGAVDESRSISQNSSPRGGWEGAPLTFKGIPYSEIIKTVLFAAGYDEVPSEGERNNALYLLVRNLRYVCDFSVEKILSVLPDWGLPKSEVENTVVSGVKSVRKVMMPLQLSNIIQKLMEQYSKESECGYNEAWDYKVEASGLLGDIVNTQPLYLRNACYFAAMTCFATLLSPLRGYGCDDDKIAPNFMYCLQAPQATGKGFLKKVYSWVLSAILKKDEELREELRKIEDENKKNANKEDYEVKEFKGAIRLLPTNVSNRILIERLDKAKKLHLMIFAEEIDSILKAEKAGKWSEKSDVYRLAYDNSRWGMDYANDNSYHAFLPLYLNLMFSGTPRAVSRFFSDIENGIVTRFLYCDLHDTFGQKRPRKKQHDPKLEQSIIDRCEALYEEVMSRRDEKGEVWIDTTQMCEDVRVLYDEKYRKMYLCDQDEGCYDLVRRRYADYAVKMMMIETFLNGGVYTDEIRDRVIGMIDYASQQMIAIFGDEINKSMEEVTEQNEKAKTRSSNNNALDVVDDVFSRKDFEEALKSLGKSVNNARTYLYRLVNGNVINRIDHGMYEKIK